MLLLELLVATGAVAVAILLQVISTYALALRIRQVLPVWQSTHSAPIVLVRAALTSFAILFLGHIVQIWLWAWLYLGLGEFSDLKTSLYFSTVTITTLGYGDIVLSQSWRLLGAIEAASGVLLFGWSTAILVAVLVRAWEGAQPNTH